MRILKTATAIAIATLSGCSAVNSYGVTSNYASDNTQKAGTYFLPKHLLKVTLKSVSGAKMVELASTPIQDRALELEAGLALSPLSDDDITVSFDKDGLLAGVTSTLTDKTAEILVEVAKLIVQFRDAATTAPILQEVSFDPFDFDKAIEANRDLRKEGVCVEVEVFPDVWSPGCGKWSRGLSYGSTDQVSTPLPPRVAPGIYYRRPAHLMVHVVQNGRTTRLLPLPFANGSPVFRIDIRRSIFVTRKTTIVFEAGALKSVQVDKKSEALAIAQFPAKIIKVFADAATGGVAGARSTALEAQARRDIAEAGVANALAARVAAGDDLAGAAGSRSGVLGGRREGLLSANDLQKCDELGFSRQACAVYWSE